jgi:hypothetical protein
MHRRLGATSAGTAASGISPTSIAPCNSRGTSNNRRRSRTRSRVTDSCSQIPLRVRPASNSRANAFASSTGV